MLYDSREQITTAALAQAPADCEVRLPAANAYRAFLVSAFQAEMFLPIVLFYNDPRDPAIPDLG